MKKATPSKDGELRFTLVVKHRVGRIDIVHSLLWAIDRGHGICDSRKDCLDCVRNALKSEGDTLWAAIEHMEKEECDRANATVDKFFPELKAIKPATKGIQ